MNVIFCKVSCLVRRISSVSSKIQFLVERFDQDDKFMSIIVVWLKKKECSARP
jgi:hypothetical protein